MAEEGRWPLSPWRSLLSGDSDTTPVENEETRRFRLHYFCRTCGTTLDTHHAACPDCGSHMVEPGGHGVTGGD